MLPLVLYSTTNTHYEILGAAHRRFDQPRYFSLSPPWIFCSRADMTETVALTLRPSITTTTVTNTVVITIAIIIKTKVEAIRRALDSCRVLQRIVNVLLPSSEGRHARRIPIRTLITQIPRGNIPAR